MRYKNSVVDGRYIAVRKSHSSRSLPRRIERPHALVVANRKRKWQFSGSIANTLLAATLNFTNTVVASAAGVERPHTIDMRINLAYA